MDHHKWNSSDKASLSGKANELHRLILCDDLDQGKELDLPLGMTFIGRNPKNDLVLTDPQVSWHHARVTVCDDIFILEDLESTNGTFVDTTRVTYHMLKNGDLVSIGPYRLRYEQTSIVLSPETASENTLLSATHRRFSKITDNDTRPVISTSKSLEPTAMDQWHAFIAGFLPTSISSIFPLLSSTHSYNRDYLRGDLVAGITVAAMLIPQGMAYAMLAGLPPIMGLYASMLPMILYALVGTSRQMSVGPVALDSILVAVGIGTLAQAGTGSYISLAILLAAVIGILQLLMGLTRLGFLVNFLSYPVLVGFTSAVAIITALSQMSHVFGISAPDSFELNVLFLAMLQQYVEINITTLALPISHQDHGSRRRIRVCKRRSGAKSVATATV